MSDFTSVCRIQISPARVAPARLIDVIIGLSERFKGMKNWESRRSPYVPNFKSIPASTIDPATGAST